MQKRKTLLGSTPNRRVLQGEAGKIKRTTNQARFTAGAVRQRARAGVQRLEWSGGGVCRHEGTSNSADNLTGPYVAVPTLTPMYASRLRTRPTAAFSQTHYLLSTRFGSIWNRTQPDSADSAACSFGSWQPRPPRVMCCHYLPSHTGPVWLQILHARRCHDKRVYAVQRLPPPLC